MPSPSPTNSTSSKKGMGWFKSLFGASSGSSSASNGTVPAAAGKGIARKGSFFAAKTAGARDEDEPQRSRSLGRAGSASRGGSGGAPSGSSSGSPGVLSNGQANGQGALARAPSRSESPLVRTLPRSTPTQKLARSSSPAPSASSTLAAERLVRLTDAQLAELSSQVSAEAYRRRTPIGALLATYERASQSQAMRTKAPTTAARIAIMTNDKFKVFAADLDAEATRRDIPGIDIFGYSTNSNTIARNNTARTLNQNATENHNSDATPPASPAHHLSASTDSTATDPTPTPTNLPVKLIPIVAAADPSQTTSPPQTPASSSPPTLATTTTTTTAIPDTISPTTSASHFTTIPRSASAVPIPHSEMTSDDRAIARDRMTHLSDDEFRALVRDLKAELSSRSESADGSSSGVDADEEDDRESRAAARVSEDESANSNGAVGGFVRSRTIGGTSASAGGLRGSTSPMRSGGNGLTQRRLLPNQPASTSTSPSVSNGGAASAAGNLTVMQTERVGLLKGIATIDLQSLWEDVDVEVTRREALGVVVFPPSTVAVAAEEGAAVAGGQGDQQQEGSSVVKRKLPMNGEEKPEPANVTAWRARISKLSNEQLAEVTADVFDEITRRKEKIESSLPAREDLSSKRNEARKELAKLPSKELKTLWTIIHDNMTERNML
ncbi:hypothetical protein HDU98_002697 [Podochytrium sp. JEL0797]|nr:hypothetical protein HDU98_002697 [Podochytrium sp. JEL0797]